MIRTLFAVMVGVVVSACGTSPVAPDDGADVDASDAAADVSPEAAQHPPFPQVAQPTDVLLQPVDLVTIVTRNDPISGPLFRFSNALPSSQWWAEVSGAYNLGPLTNISFTGPAMTSTTITDDQAHAYIQDLITMGRIPAPDDSHIYLLYLPPGVTIANPDGSLNTNCGVLGGYHNPLSPANLDSMALVQRCPDNPVFPVLDTTTEIASHEIAEAASDPDGLTGFVISPDPTMPWNAPAWSLIDLEGSVAEIGDLCGGTIFDDGTFRYQRIWSNAAAATEGDPCVPAIAAPYFSVSAAQDWYPVARGSTVDIPITAWSTGPRDPWVVDTEIAFTSHNARLTFDVIAAMHQTLGTRTLPLVSTGVHVTLHVDATRAATGDAMVYKLVSIPTDLATNGGETHFWPVGVYVQ